MDSDDSVSRAQSENRGSFCFKGVGSFVCVCVKNCHEELSARLVFLFSFLAQQFKI